MNTEILTLIGGILTILLGIFHILLPKVFQWNIELQKIHEVNQKIMITLNLALIILFLGIGIILTTYCKEIAAGNGMSFALSILMSIFWLWRFIWQIIYYKGKTMHCILILWFLLLTFSSAAPVLSKIAK